MKNTGIEDQTLTQIKALLSGFPAVEQAILFGSRAKGNFYDGSDIDIALHSRDLNFEKMLEISIAFDELDLMQTIDLVHFEKIREDDLKKHIARVGIKIYDRDLVTK